MLGQAALLLSFWLPPEDPRGRRPNTYWLITAIQHAKDAGAHRYFSPDQRQRCPPWGRQSHENRLKRLWWSCIIRDRVISLGLRRNIQITREIFDFEFNPSLEASDLCDEVHKLKVSSSDTKRALIQLTVRFVKLCVILTDLLCLTSYPEDGDTWRPYQPKGGDCSSISELSRELTTWNTEMRREFPSSELSQDVGQPRSLHTDVVDFHSHTVFLYYQ